MKNNKPNKVKSSESKKELTSKDITLPNEQADGCQRPLNAEEEHLRKGRKSLVSSSNRNAKNKVRYIEGTTPLKDGCWLSD